MSDMKEIKQRLGHLAELSAKMKIHISRLSGPEGLILREKAKEQGKRVGVGAGISFFGVMIIVGAAMYINALLIILLDLALPLWAAALIVVLGMLFIGGIIAAVGVGITRKAVKGFPALGEDVMQPLKSTSDEMKETVEELQVVAKQEAEERKQQMMDMLEKIKPMAPYIIGAYVGYRILKRVARTRRTRRIILEHWDEV